MAHVDGVIIEVNDWRVHEWWATDNMRSHRLGRKEISMECCVPYGEMSRRICTEVYCQCSCHDLKIPEGLF